MMLSVADGDLLVIRELRKLSNEAKRATVIAARTANESLKWLEWPQYVTVRVRKLMRRCPCTRTFACVPDEQAMYELYAYFASVYVASCGMLNAHVL
jgi:hypothetical protein